MRSTQGRTALVLGYGQIGSAVAREMAEHGWQVRVIRRSAQAQAADLGGEIRFERLDRDEPGALQAALGGGADAVIDTIAFTADHGRQWLEVEADIGSLTVISSVSVYCDAEGRTMDEAQGRGFPDFPVSISEDQPTIAPGPATYPSRKAALESVLLDNARRPVSILRPGAIHGENSRQPREWWFIKRILDARQRIPLAYGGDPRFHTSAADNIARLCRLTSELPATQTLNIVDPVALAAKEIGQAIGSVYGVDLEFVPLPGGPVGRAGQHPWCIPANMIMSMDRAHRLGYQPAVTYRDSIERVCQSAEKVVRSGIPLPTYLDAEFFDYEAEDAVLETMGETG